MNKRKQRAQRPAAAPPQDERMQEEPMQGDPMQGDPMQDMPLTDSDEQLYTINVDGQPMQLTLEQLIAAAEQGLSKANGAARREQTLGGMPNGDVYRSFLNEYPDIRPNEIPPEVWDAANQSGDLLGAYRAFEIKKLREELEEYRKNADNRKLDVGSARSDGEASITDPIILALMGKG